MTKGPSGQHVAGLTDLTVAVEAGDVRHEDSQPGRDGDGCNDDAGIDDDLLEGFCLGLRRPRLPGPVHRPDKRRAEDNAGLGAAMLKGQFQQVACCPKFGHIAVHMRLTVVATDYVARSCRPAAWFDLTRCYSQRRKSRVVHGRKI